MSLRFSETRLDERPGAVKLLDSSGEVILELRGPEIANAVRRGLYDPADRHGSLYEFARMIEDLGPEGPPDEDPPAEPDFDSDFLASIDIRWD